MEKSARNGRVAVSADGRGLVSQAGAVLLWETIRVSGPGRCLSAGLARRRAPRAVHDPGKIVADLAAAVALGGDCLADIAVPRDQPGLAWPVTSDPVVSRLVSSLAGDLPRALKAIRAARAAARERVWALAGDAAPGADRSLVTVDLDATIVIAHSEKEQATPTWKKNQLWCEIVALACDLLAWTQMLALTGTARRWEPKRLRLRLFAVAGRLASSGRRLRPRLVDRWPWTAEITAAAARLQALPSG